jgi:hypothetical protein
MLLSKTYYATPSSLSPLFDFTFQYVAVLSSAIFSKIPPFYVTPLW